ncbi:MAG: radical SAM protein [Anaerolineaceae bacterium]|nr:radical SAM protein [Anaerolineaceae bacterium]
MSNFSLKENLQSMGIKVALNMIKGDPEKNLPKLMTWVEKLDRNDELLPIREEIWNILNNPDNVWYKYIIDLWDDIDESVRMKFFENFIVNVSIISAQRQLEVKAEHNCNIPWAILMDPTSACNLNCIGCWAAEYGNRLNLTYEELDSIIRQGKELGTFFYLFSGGEPLVRKHDIIKLCEAHPECMFLAFTNGTLIDEAFADEMLRVKNFIPAISVEGFEAETDSRRGEGTYRKVVRAMEILKERKLIFGASCCYTSNNVDVIGSEACFDDLIDKGCKFAWFFTYIPVGVGAPTDLIATAPQREYMYHQVRKFRTTKPIFTLDFWNDGEFVEGCIAGARSYFHINANGDMEPCAFIHYSDSNIREKTLLEAYKSPLFMEYGKGQPFNTNHLKPCPLLDNNGRLADIVHASGVHSTDLVSPEDVDELCAKCKKASENWAPVAERLWQENNLNPEEKITESVQAN